MYVAPCFFPPVNPLNVSVPTQANTKRREKKNSQPGHSPYKSSSKLVLLKLLDLLSAMTLGSVEYKYDVSIIDSPPSSIALVHVTPLEPGSEYKPDTSGILS
jgi:hypothetical protein